MDDALLGLLLSPADWTFHPFIDRVDCSQCCPHLSHPSRCGGRREGGGNRPHQSWPLPPVGDLLPPLGVRSSPRQLHTPQLSRKGRSEEDTSEIQSPCKIGCRLLRATKQRI